MSAEAKTPEATKTEQPTTEAAPSGPETLEDIARDMQAQMESDAEEESTGVEKEPEAEAAPEDEKADEETAETKEEEAPAGPAAKGWAKVRKKEERILRKEKELNQRNTQIEEAIKTLNARASKIEAAEKALDDDFVGVLTKRGITFDDIARRFLADGKVSPEEAARRGGEQKSGEVEELKKSVTELKSYIEKQNEERFISDYKGQLKDLMASEEFELLQAFPGAVDEIYEEADKLCRQTGEALQPREAASRMLEVRRQELSRLSSHQAVRSLFGQSGGRGQAPQVSKDSGPKTLTNKLAATPSPEPRDLSKLTPEEDFQEALRLATGG